MSFHWAMVPILEERLIRRARHIGVIAAIRIDEAVGIDWMIRGQQAVSWTARDESGETLEKLGGGGGGDFFALHAFAMRSSPPLVDVTLTCTRPIRSRPDEVVFERTVRLGAGVATETADIATASPTTDPRWLDRSLRIQSAAARSPSPVLPFVPPEDLLPHSVVAIGAQVTDIHGGTGLLTMLDEWPETFSVRHHWQPDEVVPHLGPLVQLVEAVDDLGNRYLGNGGGVRMGVNPLGPTSGVSRFWPGLHPRARTLTLEAGMPQAPLLGMTIQLPSRPTENGQPRRAP